MDLIIDIAQRTKCDAVWVGWGHASENPLIPERLAKTPYVLTQSPPPRAEACMADLSGDSFLGVGCPGVLFVSPNLPCGTRCSPPFPQHRVPRAPGLCDAGAGGQDQLHGGGTVGAGAVHQVVRQPLHAAAGYRQRGRAALQPVLREGPRALQPSGGEGVWCPDPPSGTLTKYIIGTCCVGR